ncbi:TolC family protein [Pedobacter glucosidilyticus]|uniref:TolC family protein n=1 Tax=Pedobacter glucosidilyticus TaxID=1122941 RepID=UPI0004293560|nr:TolC family protein [Pedobacter glucosidilyticus]
MKRLLVSTILIAFLLPAFAQQQPLDTLKWEAFKEIIKYYHPVAQQANLVGRLAKARMQQAWGGFDPKLSLDYDRKAFDGTEYYQFVTPEVKIPLWYGVELKGNYATAEGAYLNPENKLPTEGLSTVGLNFSLGKGLLMDKRRAALKQARIFTEASENEQILIINDLILNAGEAYLGWQNQYKIAEVYRKALELSTIRFEAVKEGFRGGDRPAIDTVEALTQVQQREVQYQQATLDLQVAKYLLASFLWLEDNTPVEIEKLNALPQEANITLPESAELNIANNPKLLSYDFKLRDLQIERRLKAESLRPTIDLQVGLLNSDTQFLRNVNRRYWEQNNKVSFQIAMPLTFSAARGELAEAKIKIRNTELEQDLVRNDLNVKLNQNLAEYSTLQNQLRTLKEALVANQKLLDGEEMRFRFGDSSLFLINARESKLIEAQEKLIETQNKLLKNKLKKEWLLGSLVN